MAIFNSNGSIYDFYPNLPKISFKHKMNKNKAYTWNEHLLSIQMEICKWNRPFCKFNQIHPKTYFNFKTSKFKISKMSKIKIHILEIS